MIITPKDVPDEVLRTLIAEMPEDQQHALANAREWRAALALALTAWENRPQDVHQHAWRSVDVQHQRVFGMITVTHVMQSCNGCGEVRTAQLNGEWTIEQVRSWKGGD